MATWIPTTGIASRQRLDDVLIVDLDVHLHDSPEVIAPYCEQPWRDVLLSGQGVPPYGGATRLFPNFPGQWEPRRPVSLDPRTLRADLDALSIDLPVLFPEGFLGIARQPDAAYALAITRAYNRWLVEEYLGTRGFLGGIIACPQDPEGAAREIAQYASHPHVVCVILPASGLSVFWGDRRYDPIYAAAERHDLAVLYHAGGALSLPTLGFDTRQYDSWFMQHTFSHNIAMMTNCANVLATGVPARYPGLRMIYIEAGISWAAQAMTRLDWAWERHRADVPLLTEPPSAYMRRQMWYATQPIEEPADLRDMADVFRIVGEGSILFASDYPHHDFDHPKKVWDIPVSPEAKRGIMGENAVRSLRLPPSVLAERVPERASVAAD